MTLKKLIHNYRMKYIRNQSGWVMAEALIGITIITVGLLAIMASQIQTTKTATFSDNTTQATYIAQQKLEKLKKTYDITNVIPDTSTCSATNGIFTVSCANATVTSPVAGLNIVPVTATVSWTDSSSQQVNTLKLTTYYFHKD
ncbi:MAG: hypothetical protein AB9917_05005 [Negativicutes bacterium]